MERNNFSKGANYLASLKREVTEVKERLERVESKVAGVLKILEDIAKTLTEQNISHSATDEKSVTLRNIRQGLINIPNIFPLANQDDLNSIENELRGAKKLEVIDVIQNALSGSLKNLEGVLMKSIITEYNLDGTKGKKALKNYPLLVSALYQSIKREGYTFENFIEELRKTIRKLKNKYQKQNHNIKLKIF